MQCPKCKCEAIITSNENILRDNKLYTRMTFSCRNKKCDKYLKEVGQDERQLQLTIEEAPSE